MGFNYYLTHVGGPFLIHCLLADSVTVNAAMVITMMRIAQMPCLFLWSYQLDGPATGTTVSSPCE